MHIHLITLLHQKNITSFKIKTFILILNSRVIEWICDPLFFYNIAQVHQALQVYFKLFWLNYCGSLMLCYLLFISCCVWDQCFVATWLSLRYPTALCLTLESFRLKTSSQSTLFHGCGFKSFSLIQPWPNMFPFSVPAGFLNPSQPWLQVGQTEYRLLVILTSADCCPCIDWTKVVNILSWPLTC